MDHLARQGKFIYIAHFKVLYIKKKLKKKKIKHLPLSYLDAAGLTTQNDLILL